MDPFVAEIRIFPFNFAPKGWAFCDGTPQAISENETLFQLIGTTYGGDGQTTFNLPDLRGRIPLHQGTSTTGTTYQLGEMAGSEQVTESARALGLHDAMYVIPVLSVGLAAVLWAGSRTIVKDMARRA